MRVILQRSKQASVLVGGERVGAIDSGFVLLVGITHGDTEQDAAYVANKIAGLRLFEDGEGKMNLSIQEAGGSILSMKSMVTCSSACETSGRPAKISTSSVSSVISNPPRIGQLRR